ncbi:MAG TPA: GNAT family N-acetyltransferase [Candidatus Angelobacter sp.]
MLNVHIRSARASDHGQLAKLRHALWPDGPLTEHSDELAAILAGAPLSSMPLTILVAEVQERLLAGFVEVGLRSHAEGCNPLRPVGYVEGWYVAEGYRRQGIGARLIAAAGDWARLHNCCELASDTHPDNYLSQQAHLGLGFAEVERSVNYRKSL